MTDDTIETVSKEPIPFPDKQNAEQGRPIEQGPANVAGGVMNLELGAYPGKQATGHRFDSALHPAHDNGWRPPVSFDEPEPRSAPQTPAAERLAAAEDRLLGEDVARHDGKPERGAGSRYAALHPTHKAHLAAIEHLIVVEAEHAEAEARLNAVHARVEHALARVEATEEASEAVKEA